MDGWFQTKKEHMRSGALCKDFMRKTGVAGIFAYIISHIVAGSGDSWMYPYQRTPMGNPFLGPI